MKDGKVKRLIENTVLRVYSLLGRCILWPQLLYEWQKSQRREPNERSLEYAFALRWLSQVYPRDVLDVGSGASSWPHILANCYFRVTAIDKIRGYWSGAYFNRHYRVINDDITRPKLEGEFDVITCLSVLEHISQHEAAVKSMFGLLNTGGHLILSFPYNETRYVDNVYMLPEAGYGADRSYICQVFSRNEINIWLDMNSARIVDQEYYEIFSGDLWAFGERIRPPRKVDRSGRCHLTCLVMQKNE